MQAEEIAAFANGTDDIRRDFPAARRHRFDLVVCVVVGWPQQIIHSRVDDDEFLAAAALSVKHASQQNSRIANEKTAGLENELETRWLDEFLDRCSESLDVDWMLRVVGDGEPAADVEIFELSCASSADLRRKLQ